MTFRVADVPPAGMAQPRVAGSPLAAIEVRTGSQTGPIVTTANLVSTGSTSAGMVWSSQTFPISLSGQHELFFVIRSVTGGATGGNLFNLNWAEFGGNGVTVVKTTAPGDVGGSVPATLSLSLGTPASFGAFTPGVARTYDASMAANVISSAGDAALSVADPSSNATGRLVNGAFALPTPLSVRAASAGGVGGAFAPVGGRDHGAQLRGAGGQRRGDRVVPAGDRRDRRVAHGAVQQDADVHALDHESVVR